MSVLTFLGTGTSQGIPMIGCHCEVCSSPDPRDNRLRSSLFVEDGGMRILIDAGPDFRQQLISNRIDDLDAIILTHEHKDHTGGLDDVRAINYFKRKAVPVYCEEKVAEALRKEFYYAFEDNRYPGSPEFDIKIIDSSPFSIGHLQIVPIRVYHGKLPILGYKIGNFAYITDASLIPDEEFEKLKGLNIFIVSTVRKERHPAHFSLSEAIEAAVKTEAKISFLTHFSHQIGTYQKLSLSLPVDIQAAYDGLIINSDTLQIQYPIS